MSLVTSAREGRPPATNRWQALIAVLAAGGYRLSSLSSLRSENQWRSFRPAPVEYSAGCWP
jgi:hypothetical protein